MIEKIIVHSILGLHALSLFSLPNSNRHAINQPIPIPRLQPVPLFLNSLNSIREGISSLDPVLYNSPDILDGIEVWSVEDTQTGFTCTNASFTPCTGA